MWTAGKVLLVAGGLVTTYLLFAAAGMRLALRASEVQVPNLANRTANEATAAAADFGLTLKIDDTRRPDPKVEAGRVLTQDPPAGSTARRQRSIHVWLSAGQHAVAVPALIGETERAAELRLAQDGLTVTGVSEIRSDAYPADVVVSQDPAAKAVGVNVALLVNRPERGTTYVMPDLIGVNGDRAAGLLRGHGFRVAVVGSTPYPGIAAGIVVRQSPQAGFQISPDEPISLEVSR
jgi:beta-lactam-binding protein with PASTA domain